MKSAYILIGAVAYSLLGCHSAVNQPFPGSQPLKNAQLMELEAINLAQALTLSAARGAFATPVTATDDAPKTPEEKTQALIKLMKDGACTQSLQKPADTYTGSWQSNWLVGGAACPIAVAEGSEFSLSQKTYSLKRTIIMSPQFQALSGLSAQSIHGSLQQSPHVGGKNSVSGDFQYDEYSVAGVGGIRAHIAVRSIGIEGGWIELKLHTPDILADVLVRWTLTEKSYIVNGIQMDQKTFQTLFSSFELVELLDRVKGMM